MRRTAIPFLMAALSLPAAAQTIIYKCVGENGGTLISNTRVNEGCKAVTIPPETTPPPRPVAAKPPADFPKVSEDAQKARDGDRRLILEQELSGEQRGLDQARRDLAEQEAVRPSPDASAASSGIDRLAPYRDRVAQHERNIAAIQKELGGLR